MLSISEVMNENASSSAYLVDSYDIWHARLGHVSSGYIKKMQTLGLINNIDYSGLSKCQICATSKLTERTCSSVSRPDSRSDPIGRSEPVFGTRDSGLGLIT